LKITFGEKNFNGRSVARHTCISRENLRKVENIINFYIRKYAEFYHQNPPERHDLLETPFIPT
jgi:hypothetical protein